VAESAALLIWDREGEPPPAAGAIFCWRSYTNEGRLRSIPHYLESHAERLRGKYLAFIHDLGERRIAGKRIVDHLEVVEGFSLWWMTQLAEKSPFKSRRIYGCLRLLALEELLLESGASEVTLASDDAMLVRAVGRLCDNLGLGFRRHTMHKPQRRSPLRRLYEALPSPFKGLISLRHYLARWRLRRTRNPEWFSGTNSVFFCSYFIHLEPALCAGGRFFSRHWESLPEILRERGARSNWIQLFILSAAVPNLTTGLDWVRRFNGDAVNQGCHSFLDGYLSFGAAWRAMRIWLRLNAVSWKLRNVESVFHVAESAVWLWPLLQEDWHASVTGPTAIANCLALELFDSALATMPRQEAGFYLYENQAWEKALLRAWRKHGHGKLVGVQHATAPFWHLYYFDDPRSRDPGCAMPSPDFFAVNGLAARHAFLDTGYPAEKLVDTEALRYLNLLSLVKQVGCPHPRGEQSGGGPRPTRVLILGDMIAESTHNFLLLVAGAVKLLPQGYELTFKPHPGHAVDIREYPGLTALQTTESLHKILDRYDVAIAANSTSASLDAFLGGLHVIVDLSGNDLNLSALRGQSGVAFVSTPGELANALMALQRGAPPSASDRGNFFFLDAALPRWRALLADLGVFAPGLPL
jgi:surface carbohydrate biosynthesis protein (TIGR04326 family)